MGILTILHKLRLSRPGPSLPLIVASMFCSMAPAMAQDFEGKNITTLEIRYRGAKTIDENVLRNQISSKPGTIFRSDNLDDDITPGWTNPAAARS